MQEIYQEQFLESCRSGNVEEARKNVQNNGVDINSLDKDGNTGLILAAEQKKQDIIRYLLQQEVDINVQNQAGKTALHMACEKVDKEVILLLLIAGADFEIVDANKQKPGQDNMESKMFMNNIIPEKEAFNALPKEVKTKLSEIFQDIDYDLQGYINFEKARRFNKFIDDSLSTSIIEKDAKDFIKWTAVCNKEQANLDEWYFAFAKLYATDQPAYNKFIEDYHQAVAIKGKLKNFEMGEENIV